VTEAADRPTAVVTGAGRGIGRAIARRLARDGFALVVADIDMEVGEGVAAEIAAEGGSSTAVRVDVADAGSVAELFERVGAELGPARVAVANAGVAKVVSLLDAEADDLARLVSVNVIGTFNTIQHAARQMQAANGGKIIVAGSIAGRQGIPMLGLYGATKFAITGLVQTAAKELASSGITVNAYCPGIVDTDMNTAISAAMDAATGGPPGSAVARISEAIALGRIADPDDVVGLVSFLASPDSDYMTGQSLVIDGGMVFT
jgi:meso-butanediol dehydrogenase/(S,S)-butanediol dehydrogenase/diacetyl reductase